MPADLVSVQFCHAAFQALPHGGERERVLRRANNAVTRELSLESERWCYRPSHVRRLAPASTGVEAELRRYYPGLPTTVIPNAADHERFRPDAAVRRSMRATLAIPDDAVVALFLGGDWERKGLAVTMEGIAQARRSGLDLHLWVVGSGDIQGYRDRARSLDDAAWCTFHGFTTEPERFLAAADVFVSPTAYEAFPLAALEAAASGLPVVATRVNGIAELIRDGQEGVIVERTAASIAAAFTLLAGDPTMRRRMGAAARTAAARYTWAAVSQSTISAYEGLLRSRDP
jgi:UDP-glucose:(heptosyl)LPS alpha-1,3-glucosyltransferase